MPPEQPAPPPNPFNNQRERQPELHRPGAITPPTPPFRCSPDPTLTSAAGISQLRRRLF
jgi:hypothetical protein